MIKIRNEKETDFRKVEEITRKLSFYYTRTPIHGRIGCDG